MVDRSVPIRSSDRPASAADARLRRIAVGEGLKALRQQAGLTQRALAERIGLTHYTFLAQIETGRAALPRDRVSQFATALGVEEGVFFALLDGCAGPEAAGSVVSLPQVQQIGHKRLEGGGGGC
ncbi:MAG: XRE family transcriptional regulator [Alphaproteobacteria bacterium]|nr:helix-turn-helix transcriptional regulator [Alphaproteobacteria bacterium]TAD88695.1 MAG: XRE family transcriptional regulator [Alphaproteobacteria bacterium]